MALSGVSPCNSCRNVFLNPTYVNSVAWAMSHLIAGGSNVWRDVWWRVLPPLKLAGRGSIAHCVFFFFQFSACDFIALNHILSRKPCLKPRLKFKPCLKLFSSQGWEHIPAKKRLGILSHGSAQHASLLNCYPRWTLFYRLETRGRRNKAKFFFKECLEN